MIGNSINQINRHERISHFYHGELNDNGKMLLEDLGFNDYKEVLLWFAQEFSSKDLNWSTSKDEEIRQAGSPYPIGLPNAVRIAEEGSKLTLEEVIMILWKNLSPDNKSLVNQNYRNVFGFPYLVQGKNIKYCREKYKKWLEMNL